MFKKLASHDRYSVEFHRRSDGDAYVMVKYDTKPEDEIQEHTEFYFAKAIFFEEVIKLYEEFKHNE